MSSAPHTQFKMHLSRFKKRSESNWPPMMGRMNTNAPVIRSSLADLNKHFVDKGLFIVYLALNWRPRCRVKHIFGNGSTSAKAAVSVFFQQEREAKEFVRMRLFKKTCCSWIRTQNLLIAKMP